MLIPLKKNAKIIPDQCFYEQPDLKKSTNVTKFISLI